MRVDNIIMAQQLPGSHRTEEMYLPYNRRYEDMTPSLLKRALCPKNIMHDWRMCQACASGCKPGSLLVGMMTGQVPAQAEPEKPEPARKVVQMRRKARGATTEQLLEAKMAILRGESHDEVAARYGYANWTIMKRAMRKVGIAPPVKKRGGNGAENLAKCRERLQTEALDRVTKLAELVRQGMPKEEAAATAGYCDWAHARRACMRQGVKWDDPDSMRRVAGGMHRDASDRP